jgi:GTPase SAR1 family protein
MFASEETLKPSGAAHIVNDQSPASWIKFLNGSHFSQTVPNDFHMLVLGDARNGKRSLIRRLTGDTRNDIRYSASPIEYTHMCIKPRYEESMKYIK